MSTKNIGEILKQSREEKGLSIEQVNVHIKIRSVLIRSLENNQYNLLPPPAFTKVFIKSYADFLGLNGDELSRAYMELVVPNLYQTDEKKIWLDHKTTLKKRSFFLSFFILVAIILGFVFWYQNINIQNENVPVVDSINNVPELIQEVENKKNEVREDSIYPDTNSVLVDFPIPKDTHSVIIIALDSLWLNAIVDSQTEIERLYRSISEDTKVEIKFKERVELTIGNAAGALIIIDSTDTLKNLGPKGRAKNLLIDQEFIDRFGGN